MSSPAQPVEVRAPPKRIIKFNNDASLEEGGLLAHEKFWRDHQQWLLNQGYALRPRYWTDWIPSWRGTKRDPDECEDGLRWMRRQIMDAQRTSDGTIVILKLIEKSLHPYEIDIAQMFSAEPLASDPRNHCIPIYDLLQSPTNNNVAFMVMLYLRQYNDPRFATVGEAIECVSQLLECVQFLHEQRVAHRDIMFLNFMMDPAPIVSEPCHPHISRRSYDTRRKVKFSTRTRHPVRYYLIDFGISRKYPADCVSPREDPIWGGIKTVPEFHKSNEPCDPFPTDIYYIGFLLRQDFIEKSVDFEFLTPLVKDMMQENPEKRPTIDEVLHRFDTLCNSLTTRTLRSRVVHKKDFVVAGFFRALRHIFHTANYILTRKSAIPTPSRRPTTSNHCPPGAVLS
ncbi:hypothetical protein FKP32DRAFT_1755210 [Trametes sanguinea]|nr:hypothetical protein FKP32DRAFT_1755210 [Trametes sanguinea]